MDNEQYKELSQLLDNYIVADADTALFDRIVAQVQETKIVTIDVHGRQSSFKNMALIKEAAMIAATAVLGFWLGSAMLNTPTNYALVQEKSSDGVNLDKVIFGPKTVNEVIL